MILRLSQRTHNDESQYRFSKVHKDWYKYSLVDLLHRFGRYENIFEVIV